MTEIDITADGVTDAVMGDIEPPFDSGLSLTRRVYATVRERIILGQYAQGSRLPEKRIGEELDVSRVPLREAVPLLERDGFVHSFPRRSAVVNRWDATVIDELFDTRLSLEVVAARYAARQVGRGGSMAVLDDAVQDAHRVVADGDAYAIAQCSTAFHEAVVAITGNQLMIQLMAAISGRITWLFYLSSGLPADEAFHDHVLLRDAIASGNERLAEAVAYSHIERDRAPTFEAMREVLAQPTGAQR